MPIESKDLIGWGLTSVAIGLTYWGLRVSRKRDARDAEAAQPSIRHHWQRWDRLQPTWLGSLFVRNNGRVTLTLISLAVEQGSGWSVHVAPMHENFGPNLPDVATTAAFADEVLLPAEIRMCNVLVYRAHETSALGSAEIVLTLTVRIDSDPPQDLRLSIRKIVTP